MRRHQDIDYSIVRHSAGTGGSDSVVDLDFIDDEGTDWVYSLYWLHFADKVIDTITKSQRAEHS